MVQMNLQNRRRRTDLEKQLNSCCGEAWGKGMVREFGMDMYTLLYSKWITNKNRLYSTWNSAQVVWQPGRERSLGENGYMYMYV